MKQLLILSGKGGTGKTTTASAFIQFANAKAVADCDVDAPNLHIVTPLEKEPETSLFYGADKAYIDYEKCIGCMKCLQHCKFHAIQETNGKCSIQDYMCEGCGVCNYLCPTEAITMKSDEAGELSLYNHEITFSTAMLKMGRGNSGKLVSEVKSAMKRVADKNIDLAIIDGSPGIGCPVISSVSGVDLILIVAEPSVSGIHDLKRILNTASVFQTKSVICVNKYTLNLEKTKEIEELCCKHSIPFVGKIPYDKQASKAINEGKSIAAYDCPAKDALYKIFQNTMEILKDK